MSWQRARSKNQKEEREKSILAAAEKLFRTRSYEKVTMRMIARETGFSQSNLYRYFKTREEIFLCIFIEDIESWYNQIVKVLTPDMDRDSFVESWVQAVLSNERLLELTPLLGISLEKYASKEVYIQTKKSLHYWMGKLTELIQTALPAYDLNECYEILQMSMALIAGLHPLSVYSEMQSSALKEHNMECLKVDFPTYFRAAMLTYLKGLSVE